jgi:hypothetical protein
LAPVWEQTEGTKTVVICPMARYITEGCCDDSDHIPNRLEPGFHDRLKKELLVARNVLKDFFQTEGHNHCRVLDPAVDIAGKDGWDVWDKGDPTHPKAAIYDSMVAALGKAEARIDVIKGQGAALPGPTPKRPRLAGDDKKAQQQQRIGGWQPEPRSERKGWSAAAAAVAEAVGALEGATAAAPDGEEAGGAIGQTDGIGRRKDISMRRITTAAAAADGAGAVVAAEAAAGATHGEADVSGHRPSPAGVPGAAEEPTTEGTSSNVFPCICFLFHTCFISNLHRFFFNLMIVAIAEHFHFSISCLNLCYKYS